MIYENVPFKIFGVEVKKWYGHEHKQFDLALKQCIDYKLSHVNVDPTIHKFKNLVEYNGQHLPAIFLYPSIENLVKDTNNFSSHGMLKLAGRFNVGVIRKCIKEVEMFKYVDNDEFELSLFKIWRKNSGATKMGFVLSGEIKTGHNPKIAGSSKRHVYDQINSKLDTKSLT
jgi:hypothetical protein